jgi:hypothetical protein
MSSADGFLLFCTVMYFYCLGCAWMLQVVCYPTYALVGEKEFVPFHVDFGKRLRWSMIAPMVLTIWATFFLVLLRPDDAPLWASLLVALGSVVILGTTLGLELPKHLQLDREGKSDALIQALVRDNMPRVFFWTTGSLLLVYMLTQALG